MRILHVSKFAQITGGVERNIHMLMDAQRAAGYSVDLFASDTAGFEVETEPTHASATQALKTAVSIIYSRAARRHLGDYLSEYQPDLVHFHSIYHQLSSSVLLSVPSDIPRVMTLHDYKLVAPCYKLFREDQVCVKCVGKVIPVASVKLRCVKGSTAASSLCAIEQVLNRNVYRNNVDLFIAPSTSAKTLLEKSPLLKGQQIHVVAHGITGKLRFQPPSRAKTFLFIGRLIDEKSVVDLVRAWRNLPAGHGFKLRIIGDGPDRDILTSLLDDDVDLSGWLSGDEVEEAMQNARAVIVPSRVMETFGLVVAESMMAGTPVIVSDAGALPEHVNRAGAGRVFPAGNIERLSAEIRYLMDNPADADAMGRRGHDYASVQFTTESMQQKTELVYKKALEIRS